MVDGLIHMYFQKRTPGMLDYLAAFDLLARVVTGRAGSDRVGATNGLRVDYRGSGPRVTPWTRARSRNTSWMRCHTPACVHRR
ncbi:hypothetical protein IFM12275_24790 [Nocardia sputorum]|nr:hypothetical protein IFM12275_24790 [Nocardia sputorum]